MRKKFLDSLKGCEGNCALGSVGKVCKGDRVGDVDGVTGNNGLGYGGDKLPIGDDDWGFSDVRDVGFHGWEEGGRAGAWGFGDGERQQLGEGFGAKENVFVRRWEA